MKKFIVTTIIVACFAQNTYATRMSVSGNGGSCSGCKVEVQEGRLSQEATIALVNPEFAISEELQYEIQIERSKQAEKFGQESAANLSETELLLIISNSNK